jgi:predicted metal-binding membrane protein
MGVGAMARRMGVAAGTMGLELPGYLGMWLLMMTAMMLPAVSPVARLYIRTLTTRRMPRLAGFVAGYLCVWALAGLPAYALAAVAATISRQHPAVVPAAAAATFVGVAVYQLSPLKSACLRACRSPLGLFLKYAGFTGRLRDVRVGAHHGRYCLGCCWALFVALIVLGVMNMWAMIALASVVVIEKLAPFGERFSRVVAVLALVAAVLVAANPSLAGGLYQGPGPMTM